MHQPGKALCDLVDPVVQHGLCTGVTGGSRLKDGAAVRGVQPHPLRIAHQRGRGGVPLIAADGPAGAGHAVQRVQPEMPQLTAKAPRTLKQTAAGQDSPADTRAQRHADNIGVPSGRTGPYLAQQHTVGIVGHRHRQAEGTLQRALYINTDPPREIAAGPRDHAAAAVDLPGGGHADARKLRCVLGQKITDRTLHRVKNRRLIAVKADTALGAAQHAAGLIDKAQFDRRAADVNAQIDCTHSAPAYLWFLMAAV